MRLTNRWASIAAACLFAGATFAVAQEKPKARPDLDHYLPIRAALAADKLDGVKEHAQGLSKSGDQEVAKAGAALAQAADLAAARAAFGDLSKALLAEIDAATKAGEDLGKLYVFECPMAKPFGKWVQDSDSIGNPYMGSKMLKCGKLAGTMAGGCGDGCCGGGSCGMGGEGHDAGHAH